MNRRTRFTQVNWAWMSLLGVFALWVPGCNKPCSTTSQCGGTEVCAAAICQELSCETAAFLRDPKSKECVAVSGCFLTEDQRSWETCAEDPCARKDEASCLDDARCQPAYHNPDVRVKNYGDVLGGSAAPDVACFGGDPDLGVSAAGTAPGVNNGTLPKHPAPISGCGVSNSKRVYSGCRAVPKITPQKACGELTSTECGARRDCTTDPSGGSVSGPPSQRPLIDVATGPAKDGAFLGLCFDRHPRTDSCATNDAMSCLTNPQCQAIGSACYCPPNADCDCSGGKFLGCESNDRLRRCRTTSDCRANERCDNDEACIVPRTFANAEESVVGSGPGSSNCMGACVPTGCAGMGEVGCNQNPECDGGKYGTVCRPKPYCQGGGGGVIINDVNDGQTVAPGEGTGSQCGCETEFAGCAVQTPLSQLRPDRSLLVRDGEILDDPAFRLDTVLTKLAPTGMVDEFTRSLLNQIGASKTLNNGATSTMRKGYSTFLPELQVASAQVTQRFAKLMHTTSLVNRLDLASVGNCGEARITFAMTSAYTNGNQRMTMIVELKVPDDGNGCKTVAQRWAELSLVDSAAERKTRLIALYEELLKPATLGQIRTNEFINRTSLEAWELREFHIGAGGLLEQVPVAQTVDKKQAQSSALLAWVRSNAAAIKDGTAIIPANYLAAASTEDGGRISLTGSGTDATTKENETNLNKLACAGCHLTETKSPFVHVGERLGKRMGTTSTFLPVGRAVIDEFMLKELPKRATFLQNVLAGTGQGFVYGDWRPAVQARVH